MRCMIDIEDYEEILRPFNNGHHFNFIATKDDIIIEKGCCWSKMFRSNLEDLLYRSLDKNITSMKSIIETKIELKGGYNQENKTLIHDFNYYEFRKFILLDYSRIVNIFNNDRCKSCGHLFVCHEA